MKNIKGSEELKLIMQVVHRLTGRCINKAESLFFIEKLDNKKIGKFLAKLMLNLPIATHLF